MLFADAAAMGTAGYAAAMVFGLTVAFLLGDLVGLLPFFLARWKRRPGMAALALLTSGVAAVVFLPLCLPVALGFSIAALVMGRHDPSRDLERQRAAITSREAANAGFGPPAVGLTSARYLQK